MRKVSLIVILLFIINLIIAFNRNNGFQYISARNLEQLYPQDCDNDCLKKWSVLNEKYTKTELEKGLLFLEKKVKIDESETTENKIKKIAGYLFLTFESQIGNPSAKLNSLLPLNQLQLLSTDTTEQLWCGNFQRILGYFFTSLDLPNRYVEITSFPGTMAGGTHEVNEVYIKEYKKWVMIDATRNMILIKNGSTPISSADYFNYKLFNKEDSLQIYKSVFNKSIIFDTLDISGNQEDIYFNKNHYLRYYYTVDLEKAYGTVLKIKRYLLPNPWFTIYDPQNNYSNILFRIKQFFILAQGLSLTVFLFLFLKLKYYSIDRSQKYT